MAAYTCMAGLASVTVLLIARLPLPPEAIIIMILAFLGALLYSTPPFKLEASGYGELITSILVAFLLPAFAFVLQAGRLNNLVAMVAFPLTALHLAMLLAFELPNYATDIKYDKRTLMVRMGWQNGMSLYNLLILTAFLLLGLAANLGLPSFVSLPALLPLPVGLYLVWQMWRISNGAKPNWNVLTVGSLALFTAMAYLMAFAFWTN